MDKLIIIIVVLIIIGLLVIEGTLTIKKARNRMAAKFGKIPNEKDWGNIDSIKTYFKRKEKHSNNKFYIDDITWNDLDMDYVFHKINNCQTSTGEEKLYSILRDINEKDNFAEREKLMDLFDNNPELRLKVQMILSNLGKKDYNDASSFMFEIENKKLKNTWLYNMLFFLPIISLGLMFVRISAGIFFLVLTAVVNGTIYYKTKAQLGKDFDAIKYITAAFYCAKKILSINNNELQENLTELKTYFNKFQGVGKNLNVFSSGNKDMFFLFEYIKIFFLYDLLSYNKTLKYIEENRDTFYKFYEKLGEIDGVISVLSYRKSLDYYCQPTFYNEEPIETKGMYHPLLTNPVPYDILIKRNSLITGSNASGKSTFTKALAINGILAQTINTCLAHSFKFMPSHIITSMAVSDNVIEGNSYFVAEIKSLKRILDGLNDEKRVICFIDEILRGTNTIERIAASSSVLEYLADKNCLSIAATHDIELTDILAEEFDNYHFRETITDNEILFDYNIRKGVSDTRNAIKLLEFMAFDDEIVADSNKKTKYFEENRKWK